MPLRLVCCPRFYLYIAGHPHAVSIDPKIIFTARAAARRHLLDYCLIAELALLWAALTFLIDHRSQGVPLMNTGPPRLNVARI